MRTTKTGKKIICDVKAYSVTMKKDMTVGTLNKRGIQNKMLASVNGKKVVEAGTKVCIRLGYRKYNGNALIYAHGFGWMEVENMAETFEGKHTDFEGVIQADWNKTSNEDKIKLLKENFPEKFSGLNKAETLLMAVYDGKDLNEVEKEIAADKSLKYKVRKHTDDYAAKFLTKIEQQLA